MKVHVICSNPEGDSILPRISRYLRDYIGWSLSEQPDQKADLNLFVPYIDYSERFPEWNKTKTAAYFSRVKEPVPPLFVMVFNAALVAISRMFSALL